MGFLTRHRHGTFLGALLFVVMCSLLATSISDMLVDLVTQDIPFGDLQSIQSVYNFTEAFAVLFWGYVVDRWPAKRKLLFLGNSVVWISCGILLLGVPRVSGGLLLGINVAWGLAIGANGPLIASYLGDLFHIARRGRLFSIFTTALYIIKGSAIAVNGMIGELAGSWVVPLAIFSMLGIPAILLFLFIAPEPRFGGAEPELEHAKYDYHFRWEDLKQVLSKKTNVLFILQGLTGMAGVVIVSRYLLYWFTSDTSRAPDALNISPIVASFIIGLAGAGGALAGIFLAGFLADRAYRQGKVHRILYLAIACLFLQVVAYALLMLVPTYPVNLGLTAATLLDLLPIYSAYPVFLAFTIGFNICTLLSTPIGTTVGIVRTHVNLPEHRGTVAAIYDFTDFLGAGIGIFVAQFVFAAVASYRLTIVFGALFWIISGAIWVIASFHITRDYDAVRKVLQGRAKPSSSGA